jgi:hypothetical protein
MRRRIAIALLALGTVLGYGSGIARLVYGHSHCAEACRGQHHAE